MSPGEQAWPVMKAVWVHPEPRHVPVSHSKGRVPAADRSRGGGRLVGDRTGTAPKPPSTPFSGKGGSQGGGGQDPPGLCHALGCVWPNEGVNLVGGQPGECSAGAHQGDLYPVVPVRSHGAAMGVLGQGGDQGYPGSEALDQLLSRSSAVGYKSPARRVGSQSKSYWPRVSGTSSGCEGGNAAAKQLGFLRLEQTVTGKKCHSFLRRAPSLMASSNNHPLTRAIAPGQPA